jgi:hypothetical protein
MAASFGLSEKYRNLSMPRGSLSGLLGIDNVVTFAFSYPFVENPGG